MAAFEELGLLPELVTAAERAGWRLPTPIQAEAIPLILGGGDVLGAAETGSGKTAAFVLPVLQVVHELKLQGGPATSTNQEIDSVGPAWWLSDSDCDALLSLTAQGRRCASVDGKGWCGVRATKGVKRGKAYFEAVIKGQARVGWSLPTGSLALGTDKQGWGYGFSGVKVHSRQFVPYGRAFGDGDVVGCLADLDSNTIMFSVNGSIQGTAFEAVNTKKNPLHPAVCVKEGSVELRWGDTASPVQHLPEAFQAVGALSEQHVTEGPTAAAAVPYAPGTPLALLLTSSKVLAEQTHKLVAQCVADAGLPLTCALVHGSSGAVRQLKAGADVAVATAGAAASLADQRLLKLHCVRVFVLDEADDLMQQEGGAAVLRLFRALDQRAGGAARLQVAMFSATLHSRRVQQLAAQVCLDATWADLKGRESLPPTVQQYALQVDPRQLAGTALLASCWTDDLTGFTDKCHAFDGPGPNTTTRPSYSEAVKRLKLRCLQMLLLQAPSCRAMVFCRTQLDCALVHQFLHSLGGEGDGAACASVVLSAQGHRQDRTAALEAFSSGDVRVLICTDVGARGVDLPNVHMMVNMTLPDRATTYVHRAGRVGRANTHGVAVSLVSTAPEKVWYVQQANAKPWEQPTTANTTDVQQGGHTMWLNEQALLGSVQAQVGGSVQVIRLEAVAEGGALLPPRAVSVMGTSAGNASASLSESQARRLEAARPLVHQVVTLEKDVQHSYFALRGACV